MGHVQPRSRHLLAPDLHGRRATPLLHGQRPATCHAAPLLSLAHNNRYPSHDQISFDLPTLDPYSPVWPSQPGPLDSTHDDFLRLHRRLDQQSVTPCHAGYTTNQHPAVINHPPRGDAVFTTFRTIDHGSR